jgi:DNA invertase Pin-like site-specific DNA recombinase
MENSPVRAAEYMRMSTEHQQYSIANQSAAMQEYANAHSMEIVRTYVDRGKSGLRIKGRDGLKDLLKTVESRRADFNVVLVYDVSRWGRFQDVDESAYYEYALKKAGIPVVYCAEPFSANGSPTDALLKALKRAMAAEFSRDLSVKVSRGQRRIAALGFRVSGSAGFGLCRMAIDPGGSRRIRLANGTHKGIKTDRVVLVHGPKAEVRAVRQVFDWFVNQRLSEEKIAVRLNDQGVRTTWGNRWHPRTVRYMLQNPKYVGDAAFCRTITTLGMEPQPTPRENWVYVPERFEPIISRDIWNRAQERFNQRAEDIKESTMLDRLRKLLAKHGRLTSALIDAEDGMQKSGTYAKRFGSLMEAYGRVGWVSGQRCRFVETRNQVHRWQKHLEGSITSELDKVAEFSRTEGKPVWRVTDGLTITAVVVPCGAHGRQNNYWVLYGTRGVVSDVLIVARLNSEATAIMDYFVFPGCYRQPIRICDENPWDLNLHRSSDLSFLRMISGQIGLEEV